MTDELWVENTGPLFRALGLLGIDPCEWVENVDFSVFTHVPYGQGALGPTLRPELEVMGNYDDVLGQINFACGYMQSTSNITGQTWRDQMDRYSVKAWPKTKIVAMTRSVTTQCSRLVRVPASFDVTNILHTNKLDEVLDGEDWHDEVVTDESDLEVTDVYPGTLSDSSSVYEVYDEELGI